MKFDTEDNEHVYLEAREEFVSAINRGGLTRPADFLYNAADHASALLKYIKNTDYLHKYLMEASSPRDMFITAFLKKLEENNDTKPLLSIKCPSGHPLTRCISRVAFSIFNINAKNYVAEMNDEIHRSNKRSSKNKRSFSAMKIKKLKSD